MGNCYAMQRWSYYMLRVRKPEYQLRQVGYRKWFHDHACVPCVREVSEALRPSWKLAGGRLPWAWGRRWEERARGAPADSRAPPSAPEARSVATPPTAACKVGAGLEEDFRQLSEEAPSEGLTTIPKETGEVKTLHRYKNEERACACILY